MTSDIIIALNQTILTGTMVGIPTIISVIVNPNGNLLWNIIITFIFGMPILLRLIVYSRKHSMRQYNE